MSSLHIQTLGELAVFRDGELAPLPASKKTRALLGYLAMTGRPQRRDRLCEIFWEVPDDPRGALRWSLSKLRGVVNDPLAQRLVADRERVLFDRIDVTLDLAELKARLDAPDLGSDERREIWRRLLEPMLAGIDLPNQPIFQRWLTAERENLRQIRAKVASQLAAESDATPARVLEAAQGWLDDDPTSTRAATLAHNALSSLGRRRQAAEFFERASAQFRKLGLEWLPTAGPDPAALDPEHVGRSGRELLDRQKIKFCSATDGVRIAYATVGDGPPLVKAANWLNHLELDWDAPIWSPLFRELARDFQFVRYDERGNGLSDWDVGDISFEAFVTDLETVVDAVGLDRFPLLGISQGASVSIEYAARHPGRVTHLVLFGGYPAGWRVDADPATIREREAVMTLTATGWGQDNPAYRQIFSSTFLPGATHEELDWFNEFQRQTTSAENAAAFLSAFGDIDVRERLGTLRVPTLVIHSRGDRRIPFDVGLDLAAQIPGAEFLGLDSDNHLLLGRETASAQFVAAVRDFIG